MYFKGTGNSGHKTTQITVVLEVLLFGCTIFLNFLLKNSGLLMYSEGLEIDHCPEMN